MPPPDLRHAFHDLPDAPLLVGYSGGLDSTVLLHALARLAPGRLRALHVNHRLQPLSDEWARHCERECAALGIPLEVCTVQVRASGHGPEAAARHARHEALAAALRPGEVLVLAHHRDDQAETFLLRALRGSGVDGLGAMQRWRGYGRGRLWRPLLHTPRPLLEAHARNHALRWVEDPGNAGDEFDRNYLRNRVLPLLAARWPQAGAALARSASLCADASALLREQDAAALARVEAGTPDRLSRAGLEALDGKTRARVLRCWIERLGLPPLPAGGVARIERELLPAPADTAGRYHWHGAEVHAWRDVLHAGRTAPALPPDWETQWDGTAPCRLPDGSRLELVPAADAPLRARVHARRGGERIRLPGRGHRHLLKHVLQDAGVPPWERARMPLLSTPDGELLAAGDGVLSGRLADWLAAHARALRWVRGQPAGTASPVD